MIKSAIRQLAKTDDERYSVVCKVVEVDTNARTCDVLPLNGDAELLDVRLQSDRKASDGLVFLPAIGSTVVVAFLSKSDAYVSCFSKIEKVVGKIGNQSFEYTNEGVLLKSEAVSFAVEMERLLTTIDGLMDTLMRFQLGTNVGPTISVMPQVVTLLTQHKVDLAAINQSLKTILKP